MKTKTTKIYDYIWTAYGIEQPVTEYKFHLVRKWRFDFAWPKWMLAVEIDGGAFIQGRHNRGKGFVSDQEKGNAAIELGWRVLHYTPGTINFEQIKRIMILPQF